ncbi:HCLS1-associated protein X-1 isoform X1 [Pelobates fuscus]|uniref:HCLS1-associated protein X-1 isoform X1 n=1 Tax=Pelobates fuscus TaxID=191477 RepID=UPI002FE4A580
MSLFDLFRRFFDTGSRRDPFFGGITLEDEDDDGDEVEDSGYPFGNPPTFNFGFSFGPSHNPFKESFGFEGLFQDFNELFADFGSLDVQIPELHGIESPPQRPEGYGAKTLRDSMLKYPDSHLPKEQHPLPRIPANPDVPRLPRRIPWDDYSFRIPQTDSKEDRDLDSEVSSKGLDAFLGPSGPKSSSYFQSVSVSRVTKADGTTEERRTVTDGHGKQTTSVTVRRGDQILSSTTENPCQGALIAGDQLDAARDHLHENFDISDSQTLLRRILQRWFSQ